MSKLNQGKIRTITAALRGGNSRRVAAEYANISPRTLQRWMKRGREEEVGEYAELLHSIHQAEATAERVMVAAVMEAAKNGEWRAAAWWLERRDPQNWGRRQRIEVTAEEEEPPMKIVVQIGGKPLEYRQIDDKNDS